ncbi:MAG: recombinase family protein [Desulfitobacterium hafniense]|nr:recombinase family protein [Desulfitobacterium hafniense]
MNGIMYLRKSREDEQYEKNTGEDVLQTHRERLTERLNGLGYSWIEQAEVKSGDTIEGRPKFKRVLYEDIPKGAEFVCVTEIPRLSRGNMKDAGIIYETIVEFKVFIITPNKIYDPTNSSDLRQLRFELFMSREEYESIKERLWNNRNYRATQGYAGNYIVTLGFRQSRGVVEIIPEEAKVVLEIFTMRSEGYSYQEIATHLNSRGLKTKRGTQYHESTIYKIIYNPRYIGIARWLGKEYVAKHPAIIPIELWNAVQEINSERRHKKIGTKETNPYLVELYCHECGNRMYGEHSHPTNIVNGIKKIYKGRDIYICIGRRNTPKCAHIIKTDIVHECIFEELQKIVTSHHVFAELAKERDSKFGIDSETLTNQMNDLIKQIRLKNELSVKIENDYEKGELSALLYTKHVEKISKEVSALENRIRKIQANLSKSDLKVDSPDELQLILKDFLSNWGSYPNKSKKIIIRAFLPRVEVDKQKNFYIARSLPDSIMF